MNFRERLTALAMVIADEAERNGAFRNQLEEAWLLSKPELPLLPEDRTARVKNEVPRPEGFDTQKKGGRRSPSLVDPIGLARQGESLLREKLTVLDLEQLKDVVAQHGMDPGKLVMKWKDPSRIINRIVELSMARSMKGNAFKGTEPLARSQGAVHSNIPTAEEPKN